MPFFYFHLATPSGVERDEIGIACADIAAAGELARRAIPDVAATLLRSGADPMACRYDIADWQRRVLMSIAFTDLITS